MSRNELEHLAEGKRTAYRWRCCRRMDHQPGGDSSASRHRLPEGTGTLPDGTSVPAEAIEQPAPASSRPGPR